MHTRKSVEHKSYKIQKRKKKSFLYIRYCHEKRAIPIAAGNRREMMEWLRRSSNPIDALCELVGVEATLAAVPLAEVVAKLDVVITEEEAPTTMPATLTSFEVESRAFWYECPSPTTSARDSNVHPLAAMRGKELMNAVTEFGVISCSRTTSPGLFGAGKTSISSGFFSKQTHLLLWTSSKHLGLHLDSTHSNPRYCYKVNVWPNNSNYYGTHSWFQMTVSIPNTYRRSISIWRPSKFVNWPLWRLSAPSCPSHRTEASSISELALRSNYGWVTWSNPAKSRMPINVNSEIVTVGLPGRERQDYLEWSCRDESKYEPQYHFRSQRRRGIGRDTPGC